MELPPPRAGAGGEGHGGDADFVSSENQSEAEGGQENTEEDEMQQDAQKIKLALQSDPNLAEFAENIIVDVTQEGLRIQIVDRDGKPMFEGGNAKMLPHTRDVLAVVAKVLIDAPQDVSVTGHTDGGDFNRNGYTNWELSADRANASRAVLQEFGIVPQRVQYVQGKAAQELLFPDDPTNPKNRRITVTLLRGTSGNNPAARYDPLNEALPGLNKIRQEQIEDEFKKDNGSGPSASPTPAPSAAPAPPAEPKPATGGTSQGIPLPPATGGNSVAIPLN